MKSIEDLDRWIGSKVKRWSSKMGGGAHAPEVLEIHRDILEDVRDRIEPRSQGRYFFPYHRIVIHIEAVNEQQKELYQAAFGEQTASGDLTLGQEIRALLAEAGSAVAKLVVEVEITVGAALTWTGRPFRIDYLNQRHTTPPVAAERPPAKLIVVKGEAGAAEYAIVANRINIGRLKEVISEKEGLRRANDVAFSEGETTVSREHAFLSYDPPTGRFRVCDDRSQRGTSIFREGRRIEVPKGSRRGTQLQSGDEIHLGDARLRFEIGPG